MNLENLKTKIAEVKAQRDADEAKNDLIQMKINSLKREIDELFKEQDNNITYSRVLMDDLKELNEFMETYETKVKELNNYAEQQQDEIDDEQAQVDELESSINVIADKQFQLDEEEDTEEWEELETQKDNLQSELDWAERALHCAEQERDNAYDEIQELEQRYKDSAEIIKELDYQIKFHIEHGRFDSQWA